MSLEAWNTLATFGTFVVIAATAIAALVQLRHARSSNQIAALTQLQDAFQDPKFVEAAQFVRAGLAGKLTDPEFRYQVANAAARTPENQALIAMANRVGVFYEVMGLLVLSRLVDRKLALSLWSVNAPRDWQMVAPFAAIQRRRAGDAFWEHFEYLAVLSEDWLSAHPRGTYPAGTRRPALQDAWRDADAQYAANRSRA